MKKMNKIFLIIAIVIVGILIVKDIVIQNVITSVGSNIVGAKLHVGSFSSNIFTQKVRMKDIKLYNPLGFPKEYLIDIPEVGVDYDLGALLGGKLHLPLVVLNVNEMVIVKNDKGELNVDSLKVVKDAKNQPKKGKDEKSKPQEAMSMKIDLLKLNFNRVVYKDYANGPEPTIQVFEVALKDKAFENITSPQEMVTLILVQGMGPTAIKGAAIYAAAAMTGVGIIPAGIIGVLTGKDESEVVFQKDVNRVYDAALKTVSAMGEVKSENKSGGLIKAKVNGADVSINILEQSRNSTKVVVSAKQFMIPKPEIGGGVIYKLKEILK